MRIRQNALWRIYAYGYDAIDSEHSRKSGEREMAPPIGFEPMTYGLEGRCSIQLS